MVADGGQAYVRRMATTTLPTSLLRLEHAELCAECHDLLPIGTPVTVTATGAATCLLCTETPAAALRALRTDPWSAIDDPALRGRLRRRTHPTARPLALSA